MKIFIIMVILELIKPAPNHPLNIDSELRKEIAEYFVDTGAEYNIDPVLLVIWSFGESSLNPNVGKGKLDEIGMFQVHGVARRTCEKNGMQLQNIRDQIRCGGFLLDMSRRYCGSMERGLYRYACGNCDGTPRARRITKRRLKQVERLKNGKIQNIREDIL